MTAQEMWERSGLAGNYDAWAFGSAPDELARLVLAGTKTATCSLLARYEAENEPLPREGGFSVILDASGQAVCVIRTVSVRICPFDQVPAGHAFKEGEGDRSLSYWRQAHREFFTEELKPLHLPFDEKMDLVLEEFEVVYPGGTLAFFPLREKPALLDAAAGWFHQKWGVPEEEYSSRMAAYLNGETEYGWYLCLADGRIVGGLGVIDNDFHDRTDLTPNICAVYTEEAYRGQGIAGRLLHLAVEDLRRTGISPVYLLTDHTGFYERYGWEFHCMAQGDGEPEPSRLYIHR